MRSSAVVALYDSNNMILSKGRRRGILVACKPRICRIDHSSLLDAMTEQQFLREEMNA